MKTFFQLLLFIILIITFIITYNKYFDNKKNLSVKKNYISKKNDFIKNNNSIKKLLYISKIQNDNEYIIEAKSGEISDINDSEVIYMKNVKASVVFNDNSSLTIVSDKATYYVQYLDTIFEKNVRIDYLNHNIKSNRVFFDNANNFIKINQEVVYKGPLGKIVSENLNINLLNKNVDIFMDNQNKKVKVKSKLYE